MKILDLALPPQSNQGSEPYSGVAGLVNCYVVPSGDEQKTKSRIVAGSGLELLTTVDVSGGVRALKEVDGNAIAVIGRTVQQIDAGGSKVRVGGFAADGYVGIDRNQRGTGVQTIIAGGGRAAVVVGGTLTRITDSDLPPPVDVCVVNQSAVFASADGRMARSEINDATDVDGLDIATAEAVPDGLYRVVARGSDVLPIGPRSTEVWRDVGGEAFGFSRANVINVGAVGPSAVVKATMLGSSITDAVAFCAQDMNGRSAGVALMAADTPQKISTAYIDRLIDQVSDKSSIIATSWVERGRAHIAWRLTDTTIVYDTSTGLWHERRSQDATGQLTAWNVSHCTVLGGRVLAGHVSSPKLYWLDPDRFDDDGEEIIMRVRTPPLSAFPGRIEINRVFLDMVPGVGVPDTTPGGSLDVMTDEDGAGLLDEDGAFLLDDGGGDAGTANVDPEVVLRTSRDGETWTRGRPVKLGQQGQSGTRVYWNRCGTHPQVTFEFSCSAAVAREILQARWEGKALPP